MKRLIPIFALAGLTACSSTPPVHYHTLLDAGPAASNAQAAPFLIEVLPVGVPAQLDQAQMLVHEADGLLLLDNERWAGPLGDEIRGNLSAALMRDLRTQDVAGLTRPAGKPLLRIKVQVRRMEAWLGQQVQLEADWSIGVADDAANAGGARLTCRGRFDQNAGAGYPGLVQAQKQALGALAARIAADAQAWAGSRSAGCAG